MTCTTAYSDRMTSAPTPLEQLGQHALAEFQSHLSVTPEIRMHLLTSEVGELAKEVLRATGFGTRSFEVTSAFREELGDVLLNVLLLAEHAGVGPSECAALTMNKMRARVAAYGRVGSSPA